MSTRPARPWFGFRVEAAASPAECCPGRCATSTRARGTRKRNPALAGSSLMLWRRRGAGRVSGVARLRSRSPTCGASVSAGKPRLAASWSFPTSARTHEYEDGRVSRRPCRQVGGAALAEAALAAVIPGWWSRRPPDRNATPGGPRFGLGVLSLRAKWPGRSARGVQCRRWPPRVISAGAGEKALPNPSVVRDSSMSGSRRRNRRGRTGC